MAKLRRCWWLLISYAVFLTTCVIMKYVYEQVYTLRYRPLTRIDTNACIKRLPSAIIIGAAKCGTGALLRFLGHHPNIVSCVKPAEPRYFVAKNYDKGVDWYRDLMPCSKPNQLTIEKSPQYFTSSDSAGWIHEFNPNIKLLLILKDPVDKLISYFVHLQTLRNIPQQVTLEDYITDNNTETGLNISRQILHEGEYVHYIQTYLTLFNRPQVYIVDGHALEADPARELNKVETFLNIPTYFTPALFKFAELKGKYCFLSERGLLECLSRQKGRPHPEISVDLRNKLRSYYRPWNTMFFEMVNTTFDWNSK